MAETLMTPYGILSFPHLFVPKAPAENAEPRYSAVLVFTPEYMKQKAYTDLKAACLEVAREKWGANIPKNLRSPFRQCSEKDGEPFNSYPDGVFVSVWSKQKPGIVDSQLNEILTSDEVWAGQVARVTVRPFAYENSGNKGVGLGLSNVQIVKANMPRIDGRKEARKEFATVEDETADDFI